MSALKLQVQGGHVLVLGLGRSGRAAIRLLLEAGAARVTANDQKDPAMLQEEMETWRGISRVRLVAGGHPEDLLDDVDMVIKSPGIKPDLPIIQRALQRSIALYSEIELAYHFTPAMIIGITGTNGKTTTTTLVGEILKKQGRTVHVAGNIGRPLCEAVQAAKEEDLIVAELSSFQLEHIEAFRAPVAAILNITSDHMDYHGTMQQYVQAKSRLLENQLSGDVAVLNYDDVRVRALQGLVEGSVRFFSRRQELADGVILRNGQIVLMSGGRGESICPGADLLIPGPHNLENAMAAAAIATSAGASAAEISSTLRTFRGVPHRLEFVAEIDGISFINDSKATNPEAALTALKAVRGPKVLIAGGLDKGADFQSLAGALHAENVCALILLGETAPALQETARRAGFSALHLVPGLPEAVDRAYRLARSGDTILLSPACASWDMFSSFEERGEIFKTEVFKIGESSRHGKGNYRT